MADNTYDAIVIWFWYQRRLGSKRTYAEGAEGAYAGKGAQYRAYQGLCQCQQGSLGLPSPGACNRTDEKGLPCAEKGLSAQRDQSGLLGEG